MLATLPLLASALARWGGVRGFGISIPFTIAWEAACLAVLAPLAARRWALRPARAVLGAGAIPAAWHLGVLYQAFQDEPGALLAVAVGPLYASLLVAFPLGLAALGASLADLPGRRWVAGGVLLAAALPILAFGLILIPRTVAVLPVALAAAFTFAGWKALHRHTLAPQ